MKKSKSYQGTDVVMVFLFAIFLSFFSLSVIAGNEPGKDPIKPLTSEQIEALSETETEERVALLEERLEHLKSVDKKNLSQDSKKELRQEIKNIKKELKQLTNVGIYIGGGTLLVAIILLLILL